MRKKIYEIIEPSQDGMILSSIYDVCMMIVIFISLIPLAFKNTYSLFVLADKIACVIFIVDYIFRWITSDFKLKKQWKSFLEYPLTFMAIIDLLSILPSLTLLSGGLKVLRVLRLFRTFRVFRVFRVVKLFRYSKSIELIVNVMKNQKEPLMAVCTLAVAYIVISALIVFNVEPDSFGNFFDAIYWATVSLTTVGYGDIYPVSTAGRVITMLSSIFGIAIVALPAGIITAGYMDELQKNRND